MASTGQILVVDDQQVTLEYIKYFLELEGFGNVAAYECPLEACRDMQQGIIRPEVVITDNRMPGMNGPQLLKEARSLFPAVTGILMSACTVDVPREGWYAVVDKQVNNLSTIVDLLRNTPDIAHGR
jgi:DNA-binding NtrC family response regulator